MYDNISINTNRVEMSACVLSRVGVETSVVFVKTTNQSQGHPTCFLCPHHK
jgi:hypothetical protein